MILVKYMIEGGRGAVIFQICKKMAFYFRLDGGEKDIFNRAIETLALVKAMGEAVEKGVLTTWS